MLLVVMASIVFVGVGRNLANFLSESHPVVAHVLIVEGWMPDYALSEVAEIIARGRYSSVLTTGQPLDKGDMFSKFANGAEFAKAQLVFLGVDSDLIFAIPTPIVYRDRTWHMASAISKWLSKAGSLPDAINLVSIGTHARRSRLLYKDALGSDVEVGIISITNLSFDADAWWRTSAGAKTTIMELIAYLYARFLFSP